MSSSSTSTLLDEVIEKTTGKFQMLLVTIILCNQLPIVWSMLMMAFGGAIPQWWCHPSDLNTTSTLYQSYNKSQTLKVCSITNVTDRCDGFIFQEDMNTVVSQWNLVCDRDWITSTITTIQMFGLLAGGLCAGHLADFIGRKPTYFLSFLILTIFNGVAAFSGSWQMFAACRFFIGFGTCCYITVYFTFLAEFTPSKWRTINICIPAWPLWAALYGLVSWWLHDWKYIQIATAVVSAPCLLGYFFVPESFRWLISHNKFDEAEKVLVRISSMNNKPLPDISMIKALAKEEFKEKQKQYSIIDVCTNWKEAKHTFLMSVIWLCCGYGFYAITFGVQALSGDLYLNMFLISIVEAPAQSITWIFNTYVGRKWTCVGFFILSGVTSMAVGAIELTETDLKDQLINAFALTAKLGVAAAWAAIMVLGSELYPTVTRNISYGINNSMSRVGGMVAPQIIYLSQKVPGIMYFLCGGTMLLSALCSALVPETRDRVMDDVLTIRTSSKYEVPPTPLYKDKLENMPLRNGVEMTNDV